jgi:PTS system nitrogen regulatory IIA component
LKLSVREAAALLGAEEERVHDWIEDDGLPAQRIRGQYRINRTELLEWATEHDIAVAPRAFARDDDPADVPSLADALRAGGIHYRVAGGELSEVLRNIIALLPLDDDADRDLLLHFLLARDALGVAAIGDGIAIPHVRTPIVLSATGSTAALAFLVEPLPIPSPDEKPVDTLFFLICPTVHAHLAMLAKLAFCLRAPAVRDALRRRAGADEILGVVAETERGE